MADGLGYGGFSGVPYPFWLSYQSPHPTASAPPFLSSHPVESSDLIQGVFDPMMYHGSYQRSPPDWSNNSSFRENSRSQTPSSSFYPHSTRPGNYGPSGERSCEDMFPPSGFYSSRESSSDFASLQAVNFSERQRLSFVPTYSSATSAPVASYAEMVIRNSQEPFFMPIASSGVYASSNAVDDQRPGYYFPGSDGPETLNVALGSHVESVCVTDSNPSLPISNLETQALFDGSQTGIRVEDGRSFRSDSNVCSHAPENFLGAQSSLHGSSIEPVNFDVLLGNGEATGHIKPLPENPDLQYRIAVSPCSRSPRSSNLLPSNVKSSGSLFKDKLEGSGVSSLYQRPYTLVADSENGVSESSLKNAIEDLNCDEHKSWNHFMVSSEGPSAPTMFSVGSESRGTTKADNENAESAVNYKPPFEGNTNQPSEDVQANQKPWKHQQQILDIVNRDKMTTSWTDMGIKLSFRSIADDVSTGRSPERHLCDQGDFPPSSSSPRVSSVVNAMHNLSEVLVYECFNNGNGLKLEQLENLDKVVDNLTKCLKKITSNKTIAGEASLPTQAMHVSCPNVVDLNESLHLSAPKVDAKDFQEFHVKPLDSFGMNEPVDKNEMTQSIKNILASNFPDDEENHPQTLLYKNLWLETEAALCSTTCMARYHRIKNEIGNLKLHDEDISADASTSMQEPSLNPQKSVPIMNNAEHEKTESLIKNGSNYENNVVTMTHDAPQSSRFNPDSVDAVLSLMSRSFADGLEQAIHGNLRPDAAISGKIPDAIQQESPASPTEDKHNDVLDRFQILKHQETRRKLKSHDCPDSEIDVIDRFEILKQQETNRKLKSQNFPVIMTDDLEESSEALEVANIGRSSHVSNVMDRFQILKRREAEQEVQKSLNSLDVDPDSDSDNDQPSNKTQLRDHLWSASMITIPGNSQGTYAAADTEPSASGKGYESPTSDWEHVHTDA